MVFEEFNKAENVGTEANTTYSFTHVCYGTFNER